jgi:uncharacterized damage-inducible protein DinB
MISKKHIINEFQVRVFDESYVRIYKCLSLLNEEQLWESPHYSIPSVGSLILHLSGNARQWILSGLGNEPDNRRREEEFQEHRNIRKADFIFLLEILKTQLATCLNELNDDVFKTEIEIQGFKVTGFSLIVHVIEHFSYHTGQITTLTKLFTNKETGYYADLNLNATNRLN